MRHTWKESVNEIGAQIWKKVTTESASIQASFRQLYYLEYSQIHFHSQIGGNAVSLVTNASSTIGYMILCLLGNCLYACQHGPCWYFSNAPLPSCIARLGVTVTKFYYHLPVWLHMSTSCACMSMKYKKLLISVCCMVMD